MLWVWRFILLKFGVYPVKLLKKNVDIIKTDVKNVCLEIWDVL